MSRHLSGMSDLYIYRRRQSSSVCRRSFAEEVVMVPDLKLYRVVKESWDSMFETASLQLCTFRIYYDSCCLHFHSWTERTENSQQKLNKKNNKPMLLWRKKTPPHPAKFVQDAVFLTLELKDTVKAFIRLVVLKYSRFYGERSNAK